MGAISKQEEQEIKMLKCQVESNFQRALKLSVEYELLLADDDPGSADVGKEIQALLDENKRIFAEITKYRRPNGVITGIFSRMLGPLPQGMRRMEIDEGAERIMRELPSYRLTAFGLIAAVVGGFVGLSWLFPWLRVSPLSVFLDATATSETTQGVVWSSVSIVLGLLIILALLATRASSRRQQESSPLYNMALVEEQWFRSGAENWTPWQRVVSCVAFGFCHIINIIYPALTLILLSVVGAVFMTTYLQEYRRSQDVQRATLAATKLHAMYNTYALWFFVVGVVLLVSMPLL